MIIKSTFRQAGGLEAHLLRNDTNESVRIRVDLFRNTPSDLHNALRLMDGISRSNARTKRSFIHVVIAPALALDDQALAIAMNIYEQEFGIASDAPRAVVQHEKGRRPSHFHVVYSIVDLGTGLAIKSHNSFTRDELVSRICELQLDEKIIPGPRLNRNIAELKARGMFEEAGLLAEETSNTDRNKLPRQDHRQAERLGIDTVAMSREVFRLYEEAGRELETFEFLLRECGYSLSRGDNAVLVGVDRNGFQTSLARCLRREGKVAGRPVDLEERDLVRLHPRLISRTVERDAGLVRATQVAAHDLDAEWQRSLFEALADADEASLQIFRTKRKKERARQEAADQNLDATLKAQRDAILDLHRRRDDARWARVDRAFRSARLFGSPTMRNLAFALATAGMLMTGAGLVAALLVGTSAAAALPSMQRARNLSAITRRERTHDRTARDNSLRKVNRLVRAGRTRVSGRQARFSFNQVAKGDRILAGAYAVSKLEGSNPNMAAAIEKALGNDIASGIGIVLERGSLLQIRRLRHWYSGVAKETRESAVRAALERHAGARYQDLQAVPFIGKNSDPPSIRKAAAKLDPRKPLVKKTNSRRSKEIEK